ncbi:synaptopodin 2-like protein isoform X1 [Oryzias latipes]|uniref:Synaptopodin 2-like protein n=1 Tax=Oryzias latipes TaxID=8090 RepID=A0A3B3IGM4_ORYLA|nr:synaptopodin 2-like protein isoform X1 [Oryzias latipes]
MVAEEIEVSLTGGAPWGFRLQGGAEQHKPLQVAKVRKRSKACRAGLKEQDELVSIDDHTCAELSHAQAMKLIDSESATLKLKVKRIPSEFRSSSYAGSSASPQSSLRVGSPPVTPLNSISSFLTPVEIPRGVTSPPDSEAYYGETDSDADTRSNTHQRRQRRTPPHIRSPARYDDNEEETSEMSGYESATEPGVSMQDQWNSLCLPGVPRRNIIYLPAQKEWNTPTQTPNTPTPHTLTPTPDLGIVDGEGEGDSGFQEVGGCTPLTCPPLVSPERAKDVLVLGFGNHLVPMVGPQQSPVSEELSTTYMDKARQAKLQRGESAVEKQVKEARTKCRSIASLLTDAPNPNSKGVLMFKKRRQRAKKYTLTCFGKAEGGRERKTEGDTEGETEEEGGSSALSGSEVDEEDFSASFDPTWDSGYFELLEKKSSACPSTTPTTPSIFNDSTEVDILDYQTPQLLSSVNQSLEGSKSSANHSSRQESRVTKEPVSNHPVHMSPLALAPTSVESVSVSRASVVLSPPSQTPIRSQNGLQSSSLSPPAADFTPSSNADVHGNASLGSNASVLNRTARPFSQGSTPSRASVTSVMFRPPQPKPTPITMATKPVAAVSMVTISPTQHPQRADARRTMSSTSLYIPPRNNTTPTVNSSLSPPSPQSSASLSQPTTQKSVPPSPFVPHSPSVVQGSPACPSNALPLSAPASTYHPSSTCVSTPVLTPNLSSCGIQGSFPVLLTTPASPPPSANPYINPTAAVSPQVPATDSISMREQRISVPAARSGILQEARRRSSKKPMFTALQSKDVSPNPDLMSMVQNMDGGSGKTLAAEAVPSGEAAHESGPEEDWLRLGAEACNFMQAQQGHKPPPVAPKPQVPEVPQLAGKGGQLFARRQSRMDRYVVERCPSAAPAPFSPTQTREPSPTPSLPATWKYSSNIRAPPPINYNPLLSPSCPLKAQKKPEVAKSETSKRKGQKVGIKPVDIMSHQPYQLNSSLFSYGGGVPQDTSNHQQHRGPTGIPQKTARIYEVKRFSTPPPMATGPTLKVVVPRSATTLGEPYRRSEVTSPPLTPGATPYQHHQSPSPAPQPQWIPSPVSSSRPPAPTAPLPKLPTFSSGPVANTHPLPTFSPNSSTTSQANKQFKSAPNLSPLCPGAASQQVSRSTQPTRVPRPRFSTSNLGLQPCVWRPGSTAHGASCGEK